MAALAITGLVAAFFVGRAIRRGWAAARAAQGLTPIAGDAPDSVQLAALGIRTGRELTAVVLVSSQCGFCQDPTTKKAIAQLRPALARRYGSTFRSIRIVGVALDRDILSGLDYLRSIGLDSFDEVSTGEGVLNTHQVNLIWRMGFGSPLVPQVLLVGRDLSATAKPFIVRYSPDSLIASYRGRTEVLVLAGAAVSPARAP